MPCSGSICLLGVRMRVRVASSACSTADLTSTSHAESVTHLLDGEGDGGEALHLLALETDADALDELFCDVGRHVLGHQVHAEALEHRLQVLLVQHLFSEQASVL